MNEKLNQELLSLLLKFSLQDESSQGISVDVDEEFKGSDSDHKQLLQNAHLSFQKKYEFKVGQFVKWKKELKNRKLPLKNQPAIVIETLEDPIVDHTKEPGSPYFLEPLDIVLGVLDDENVFLTFYYDSRRFEVMD